MNEKTTRQKIIDSRLLHAGWNVDNPIQVVQEFDILINSQVVNESEETYTAHRFSDYLLLGKNGKPLAIVEAKKSMQDAAIGREQAKQYCYHIKEIKGGELPFCFYTNGHDIYFWNLENYPPQKVFGFPTQSDLERLAYIRSSKKNLTDQLINHKIAGRDYQLEAIRAIMEGIQKQKRKFLLVMATGTGKTRTCIALVDTLMRAGWAEKVLFLVDRIALRNQALDAFKEHLPNEPRWPKQDENVIATDRRIYVSTYPTMLNIIRDDKNPLSAHFFDLIIVDESHRSIYNTYQEVINYFNTITLGLTATPTDVIDHNTFGLFECEDGVPNFAYSYEEAVTHIPPYLCNFQVMKIKTRFQEEGISKRTISLQDQQQLMLQGKEIAEINYEGTDLEKKVINRGTNALIVREFMEECIKDSDGVLPGKTIFFCITKAHARRIEQIFDSLYPQYKGELAKVIVSDDSRVYGKNGLLAQFTKNDMPRVAISVGMLDTGIDIRELVNLVFAKPVYSYTRFWQMIGRGTRLLEEDKIKPWCTEKDSFLILDCWDNFEYFKINPRGKDLKAQIPLPVRLFGLRLDKTELAIIKTENEIAEKEIIKLRNQVSSLPADSITILDAKHKLQPLEEDTFWKKLKSASAAERDGAFEFLRNTVKPLFRTLSDADFKAMRFEKDVLEISLAHLEDDKNKYATLQDSITEQISQLPLSINIVAREEALIRQSQANHFWATITDAVLDELTYKIAPLMKFRETVIPNGPENYNLKDVVVQKEFIEFGPQHEALSVAKYKELVEQKINELVLANPVLNKIKQGENISETEAEALAEALNNEHPHITLALLRRVYNHRKAQLVQFIKHILGIEILESFPETVANAFNDFITSHTYLSSRQLQFLTLLRNYILEKETLQKRNLIESPFTMIHPEGIRGVFSPAEIDEILGLTNKILAA